MQLISLSLLPPYAENGVLHHQLQVSVPLVDRCRTGVRLSCMQCYGLILCSQERCRFRKVDGGLPSFWGFLELAKYTGQVKVRSITYDVWEFYVSVCMCIVCLLFITCFLCHMTVTQPHTGCWGKNFPRRDSSYTECPCYFGARCSPKFGDLCLPQLQGRRA